MNRLQFGLEFNICFGVTLKLTLSQLRLEAARRAEDEK
jgi:hypothetical protein